ncbi:MAG TPA: hypothetical protein VEC12_09945 [Bacteroidia bacterium]|nr:hypothetical protein [Bacteroidia bacterium]
MKAIITVFFALAIIVLNSCKEEEPDEIVVAFPEDAVNYFYFKTGSYWIYQNNKTNEVDSVWVHHSFKSWYSAESWDKKTIYKIELIRMECNTSSYGTYWSFDFRPFNYAGNQNNVSYSLWGGRSKISELTRCTLWKYPFNEGINQVSNIKGVDTSLYRIAGTHNTVTIGSKTYSSVLKVNITNCIFMDKHDINMYWAPNYGIIKIEDLDDSSSWELVRHHLIQ